MKLSTFARVFAGIAGAFLFGSPCARAVVVAKDNSSIYTQAPTTDDFGFRSVGIVFNSFAGIPSSGVYLGDGWVLSAYHNVTNGGDGFTFGYVVFDGISYVVDPLTATRLHNDDNSLADLAMFQLTVVPGDVPAVNLAGVSPSIGASVRMMGNGQDREATETQWLVASGTWSEVPAGGNAKGYELTGTRALRWGNNNVEPLAGVSNPFNSSFGRTFVFGTRFDEVAGEAMATGGDSGGGVFLKNGSIWELGGVMLAATGFSGQPDGTVVYGNQTIAADVSFYREEIQETMANIPEPSSAALLGLAGLACARRRRMR